MVVDLICFKGGRYTLPQLFDWQINHGSGEPCDSIELCCAYAPEMAAILPDVYRLVASRDGEVVFAGIPDEWEARIDGEGAVLSLSGRGMAALLLDNEVEAAEFGLARLEDILDLYVRPFGITDIDLHGEMAAVESFTVESGSSAWDVLCDFCRVSAQIMPRFSAEGKLIIGKKAGRTLKVGPETALYALHRRDRRYGILSEVLVKDKMQGTQQTVQNAHFAARGGRCRRVLHVPRYSGYEKMRWTAEYQIRASEEGKDSLELHLLQQFAARPGDSVLLERPESGFSGSYLVKESVCFGGERGAGTRLTLVGG